MNTALKLLESYSGRDCVLRTIQYGTHMTSGMRWVTERDRKRLLMFTTQLGLCRTTLRLFDDLPMLAHSISYGFGSQEKSLFIRLITVAQNLSGQLFYPVEHIAWASEVGILSISAERWNNWSVYCWFISIITGIILNLIKLSRFRLQAAKKHSADMSGGSTLHVGPEELSAMLSIVSDMADLVMCIHWFPPGLLWSGKLSTFSVGCLGFISSIIPLWKRIQTIC